MMATISLSSEDLALIRHEGEANYPEECCGFLFGQSGSDVREVSEVQPIGNVQDVNRARRFLISPEEFRRAEMYAQSSSQELLGFYHTHPDHPAIPSEFDREHALPFYSYIILSVRGGTAAELRSWLLDPDREHYTEEQVDINSEVTR